ncbi:helix-turn-helix transcriptional regulator [Nocardia colli]|uniref:Helix-turn-helix transcriptional regulator n=1 Tax=Nocardia colli TaxID=2545717 RepID=A0A5N0E9L4_9NOCA|nr:LuxR C-terminal-related transcriptional regulator [Nocardia colli]KAA8885440.1 helix-turn-helix transcriptional regulator [Nocardia colli]
MLVGRKVERDLVAAFVLGQGGDQPVLVVRGDPGVGKTAVLELAADIAGSHGVRVLRAAALEYEAELKFGALNQLLHPLSGAIEGLGAVHRDALRVILGLAPGAMPTQLIAGAATLALLRASAESGALLLIVDDVQWLDLSSTMALSYAARRWAGSEIRLLVAVRADADDGFTRSGFRVHDLAPLDDSDSDALLLTVYPALTARVRRRLRDDAQGNPLALLELPAAFENGTSPANLPAVLPLTDRLQRMFADRLAGLPAGTRRMLLFVILAGAENSITVDDCAPTPRGAVDLPPAERAGIVRTNPRTGRVEFRHPLIRAAVIEQSTSAERREVHRILAEAFADEPQRRAWHLGQAAVGPDEEIAASLESLSQQMIRHGDGRRAMAAMLRAAELSISDVDRARRTARAAYLGTSITGDLADTSRLLLDANRVDARETPSLEAAVAAAAQLLNDEGDATTANRLLLATIRLHEQAIGSGEDTMVEALHTLLYVGFYSGRPELWDDIRDVLERAGAQPTDTLSLLHNVFANPVEATPAALRDLTGALDGLRFTADPLRIIRVATAGAYVDRVGLAREALWRVIIDGRHGGAVAKAIEALFLIAQVDFFEGEWAELIEVTDEGLQLCAEFGYSLVAGPGRFLRALVDAARGDTAADLAAEELLLWAAPRRLATYAGYSSHIRCLSALGRSSFDEAYRHAASVNAAGSFPRYTPHALWLVLDLTEAAARSGRTAEARAHAEAALAAGLPELSGRLGMLTKAALAVADSADWRALFEDALATPGSTRWVFDCARIELLYGERLRREREPAAARAHLTAAAQTFERLQAIPWLERTRAELRATGDTEGRGAALTPQERAVAELAASGLTNKEIAERLFLSARTVSTHLHRVFPKLGITTRSALRDAMSRQPG